MFRRSAASEDEDGRSSRSRSRSATKRKQSPSQRSDFGERISRILRSTPSQQHLPPVPSVSATTPSTPTAVASSSRVANSPTSANLESTPFLSKLSGSSSVPLPRPSPSIDSLSRRQSLGPPTLTSPTITHTPASASVLHDEFPTTSTAPVVWDSAIAGRLRAMSSHQLPTGYFSTTDGDNTETEWETDAGGMSLPRFQGASSDYGMPGSSDDDGDSSGQKGKGRPANSLQPPARIHTLSNASSASSLGSPLSRVPSNPPPVPSLPAEFSFPRSRRKPHLSVNTSNPPPPAEDFQEPVAIAVVGAPGCGKSDFVWKGMKDWGLNPHQNVYDYSGIPVSTRSALLAARQSFFTPTDSGGGGGAGATRKKENAAERKRYFRVTILEVSSTLLLGNVPSSMEEVRAGDGLWAWPTTLPKVDGILVCYDANDPASFRGVNELCAAYYSLRIPTVIVQCKSDLEQLVPAEHVATRASGYSIGLVVTSTRTDVGKKKAKDSFGWFMKAIWRKRRGKESDDTWNPASPDVLTAQSWEFEDAVNIPPSPPQANSNTTTRSVTPTPMGITLLSTNSIRRGSGQHSANSGSVSSIRKPPNARSPSEPTVNPPALPTSPTLLIHPNSPARAKSTPDLARLAKRTSAVRFTGVGDSDPESPVCPPPAESASQTSASAVVARNSIERSLRSSLSMSDLRQSETPTPTQTQTPPRTDSLPHLTQVERDAAAEAQDGSVTVALLLPKLRRPLNPMQFATFDEIITKLAYLAVTEEDPTPIDAFFATYRRFATPRAVLVAFKKRLIVLASETRDPTTARLAEMKIAGLIENWLYQYPNDFSGKPANSMFLDIIRLMMKRPHLAHYGSDLYPWASKVLNRRDSDVFWTVREDEQGYGAEAEEPEDEHSRRNRRQDGNDGVRVAVTTTTTVETDDEQELLPSTAAVPSTPPRNHRSVRSSAFATKGRKHEPPTTTPLKGAKRSRSTPNFKPSYIENLLGASSSRRMMEPLPPDASTKAILRELNKAADQILRAKAQEVAEEITRLHSVMFLAIKPRHWLQHVFRPQIELADDDPGPPPEPPMDTIDRINYRFNRLGEWTTSVILGPDGFMRRAKVAEHFISIALALRRLNNYFGAHALTNGIRGTLVDGDTLEMKVAETPDFKLFLSMEKLFSSRGSFSAYRLALRNSHGPVIPDLSIHTPDMGRTNVIPNRKIGDPERLNWGKFMQLGRGIRHIQAFQKRFEDWSSHNFIERPFIKAILENSPVLEDEIKHRRSNPMVPEDGSENPTTEKVKRFLGM